MKNAIILSGGTGSRLQPLTHVVNKHLLGVNGKFVIDYPLNTLKQMGIENCTVVLGGSHFSQVVDHLKDGRNHGMNFNYVYQGAAQGIAQAINLCKRQVADDKDFVVILGDNIFEKPIQWGYDPATTEDGSHAQIVLHNHPELNRFGVATVKAANILKIEEKPKIIDHSYDNYAITGCYLFTQEYFEYFKEIKPSARGEYEITDIINKYNENDKLGWTTINGLWSDAGTHESIAYVNNYFFNKEHKS